MPWYCVKNHIFYKGRRSLIWERVLRNRTDLSLTSNNQVRYGIISGFVTTGQTPPFTISGGTILQMNLTIQPVNVPQATVNGFIKQQNGTPIPNACVGLYSLDLGGTETLLQVTFTSSTGFYFFGRVPEGNYVVKAKSEKLVIALD